MRRSPRPRHRLRVPASRPRGMALVAVMLVALVVLGLGISLAVSAGLTGRVAASARDRQLAFEAAEAALRDAEAAIASGADFTPLRQSAFTPECRNALCASAPQSPVWPTLKDDDWEGDRTVAYGAHTGAVSLPGLSRQPRVMIEYQGTLQPILPGRPCEALFLITASARGGTARARVMLQSTYRHRAAECYGLV